MPRGADPGVFIGRLLVLSGDMADSQYHSSRSERPVPVILPTTTQADGATAISLQTRAVDNAVESDPALTSQPSRRVT